MGGSEATGTGGATKASTGGSTADGTGGAADGTGGAAETGGATEAGGAGGASVGGAGGAGNATVTAKEVKALLDAAQADVKACGMLTEGKWSMAPSTRYSECRWSCVQSLSCSDWDGLFCGTTPSELEDCFDACEAEVFTCKNGEEVLSAFVCDTEDDCDDGSDEEGCSYFECTGGGQVNLAFVCDGEDDCLDGDGGSDEAGCALVACQ